MKRCLIEIVIITILWLGCAMSHKIGDTAGVLFDSIIMVLAAKGTIWEYEDWKKLIKGEH